MTGVNMVETIAGIVRLSIVRKQVVIFTMRRKDVYDEKTFTFTSTCTKTSAAGRYHRHDGRTDVRLAQLSSTGT